MPDATFWHPRPGGVVIAVKVQPRARRTGVLGVVASAGGPRLRIGVSDPPEDGKANKAVRAVLAAAMGVPQATIEIVSGATSREKSVLVSGETAALVEKLTRLPPS
jgi:uncharacterized protein (TIGR00251 family)